MTDSPSSARSARQRRDDRAGRDARTRAVTRDLVADVDFYSDNDTNEGEK